MVSDSQIAGTDSPLIIRRESPLDAPGWNTQIAGLSRTSFFQSSQWARVLCETYGFTPAYFTARNGHQLEALFPAMEVNSPLTGRRGVSLPFSDHCESLGPDSSVDSVFADLLKFGKNRNWKYLEWRGGRSMEKLFNCHAQPSTTHFVHQLNLERDPEKLFNRFDSAARRAVRKAEKSGVTIEISRELSAVRDFYRLHCGTRKEHGLPPQPFTFFLNIHRHILSQNSGMVFSARYKTRAIASAIFFHFGSEAIYKFGASDAAFLNLRGNNLIMWEAIRHFALEGMARLNFGRTSKMNPGLRHFKTGWGAEETEAQYYRYDFRRNAFMTSSDGTVGNHTRIFQLMPICLSRLVGSILYRHIA